MEDISNLIALVLIVFGVLQIILFFKIWKMTNDVSEVKDAVSNCHTKKEITKAFIKGDKERLRSMLIDNLIEDLYKIRSGENGVNIIEQHKRLFEQAGEELPEFVQGIKKRDDIKGFD